MPAATHRSTIWPPRHRLTFRFTCRVRLIELSIALVVASDCRRRSERPEREDGQRLVEPFADARRRTGILVLEAPRQILQQPRARS